MHILAIVSEMLVINSCSNASNCVLLDGIINFVFISASVTRSYVADGVMTLRICCMGLALNLQLGRECSEHSFERESWSDGAVAHHRDEIEAIELNGGPMRRRLAGLAARSWRALLAALADRPRLPARSGDLAGIVVLGDKPSVIQRYDIKRTISFHRSVCAAD